MHVYRVISARHRDHLLDGRCAARTGGRWNFRGFPAVYISLSISLALLEAVRQEAGAQLVGPHCLGIIDLPARFITHVDPQSLPARWRDFPSHTQAIGARWLNHGTLALVVPSVIHDQEGNVVLNPAHRDYHHLRVEHCGPVHLWEHIGVGEERPDAGS
ncbi:MAG TPA: RES family NAD+ phosphorylase [Planctomycetota bacterium]|nr:RES family NAD+ phosphorylase [Planctomycetota bacterium]